MFELKTFVPKTEHTLLSPPDSQGSDEPKQQRMMVIALTLLLIALGFVLYRDRDFWFPDDQEAVADQPLQSVPATVAPTTTTQAQPITQATTPAPTTSARRHTSKPKGRPKASAVAVRVDPPSPVDTGTAEADAAVAGAPVTATTQRTVLPPLEVEVVAGDVHRTVRPGSNSVRVDLEAGSPMETAAGASTSGAAETTANLTSNAAERVQMSADTAEVVSRPVKPGYPMLARQMKVQGSVILQALIGRDGMIQDLRVLSGPPILASAAQEAVKQWHFKPHYLGPDAVETQAKITVNFTISTN